LAIVANNFNFESLASGKKTFFRRFVKRGSENKVNNFHTPQLRTNVNEHERDVKAEEFFYDDEKRH
jgi:hypothetical protein